jgi:hypothetical protein
MLLYIPDVGDDSDDDEDEKQCVDELVTDDIVFPCMDGAVFILALDEP